MKSLQRILDAARRHGEESDPDHETGDLIDVLRAVWPLVPPNQRRRVMKGERIAGLLEEWGTLDVE
jgi:hypothetical protein